MNALNETPAVFSPPSRLRRIAPLLGLILLAYVLARLDTRAMGAALLRIDARALALATSSFALNILLKGVRWWRMLAAQNRPLPLRVAVAAYVGAQFYGQVTIGRVGEFFRAEAVLERGETWANALSSCIVDRLFDVAAVCLLGLTLGALLTGWVVAPVFVLAAALGVGITVAIGGGRKGFRVSSMVAVRLSSWLARAERRPWIQRGLRAVGDLLAGMRPLWRPAPFFEACFWTAAGWTLHFAALWSLAVGLGVQVPWLVQSGAASLVALSTLLPVTVSGLGAREVIYQQVFGRYDVSSETAVVLALLHLAVMTFTALSCGACGLWIRTRQRDRSRV